LPGDWRDALFAGNKSSYLRKSERSANFSEWDFAQAAELGSKPLDRSNVKVFNALPNESGRLTSLRELWKMDLEFGDREAWQDLNSRVKESANSVGLPLVVAKKTDMLQELKDGGGDVIFIVAHGTGESIYLPGTSGDSISVSELAKLKRDKAPNRIAVLITCKGGTVNGGKASIGEALLQHKLARAVYASSKDLDARDVPELIRELVNSGRPVQEVMSKYDLHKMALDLLRLLRMHDA
jgi:hypothetical protein